MSWHPVPQHSAGTHFVILAHCRRFLNYIWYCKCTCMCHQPMSFGRSVSLKSLHGSKLSSSLDKNTAEMKAPEIRDRAWGFRVTSMLCCMAKVLPGYRSSGILNFFRLRSRNSTTNHNKNSRNKTHTISSEQRYSVLIRLSRTDM